jgi:hypothetical protein
VVLPAAHELGERQHIGTPTIHAFIKTFFTLFLCIQCRIFDLAFH